MTIIRVPISSVALWDKNPRGIKEKDFARLKKQILKLGVYKPLVAFKDGEKYVVLGGNMRLRALQEIGVPEVELSVVEAKTQARRIEFAMSDNDRAGYYEEDALAELVYPEIANLDLSEFKVDLGEAIDLKQVVERYGPDIDDGADEVPEADDTPAVTKAGDLFTLGRHRLLCGDSTKAEDVARVMRGEKADAVFTSPPYAVGIDYGTYKDTIGNLRSMLPLLSKSWLGIVTAGGYAVVNFGDIVSASDIVGIKEPCEYPMALEYWPIFRADGWALWSRRIWCKPGAGTGSMQCISSNRAATNWEHVWTWKAPGKSLFTSQLTGKYPSQNGWFDTTHEHKLGVSLDVHGAGMPVTVAERGIVHHVRDGHVVYEPFCGTGTTLVAAEKTGRICYGIEIDPKYCDVIIKRYCDYVGADEAEVRATRENPNG